jgi:ketosteroid isomerase-like protein
MKVRLLVTLAGLAIGYAVPAFAQEKETVDPQIRQQLEAIDKKYDEAFDKHDAAAIAALYTQNAVLVAPDGVFSGQEAIEKRYAIFLPGSRFSNHINKLDQVHTPLGMGAWAVGSWIFNGGLGLSQDTGFRFLVYVPEGDTWKIRTEVMIY